MVCYNDHIILEFDRHLGSTAAEGPVKFQSNWKSLNPNLLALRFHETKDWIEWIPWRIWWFNCGKVKNNKSMFYGMYCPDSKDHWIDFNKTLTTMQHFRIGLMSNNCWFEGLCYMFTSVYLAVVPVLNKSTLSLCLHWAILKNYFGLILYWWMYAFNCSDLSLIHLTAVICLWSI